MKTETKSQSELVSVLADINDKISLELFYSIETGHGRIKLQGDYTKESRQQCEAAFGESFYLTDENWVKLHNDELNLSIYLILPD